MFANMSRGMAVPWLLRAESRTKQGLGPGGAGGAHCKAPTLPQATRRGELMTRQTWWRPAGPPRRPLQCMRKDSQRFLHQQQREWSRGLGMWLRTR